MTEPRRILVTGAGGFVGRHLMRALREAFPGAVLLAASHEDDVAGADAMLPLDLPDAASVTAVLTEAAPDAVFHLAAQAAVPASFADPMRSWRVNVDGSLLLAQTMLRLAPEALLVFASSAEVYGLTFRRGVPLDEDAPMAPANPYAASKAAADIALGEMALRGLRLVRMRPFNHVGPGQSDAFVVPAFARQIARIEAGLQEPVMRVGALDRWRDFLDVRDVCNAYVAVLRQGAALENGVAVNLASGHSRRVGDILQALLSRTSVPVRVEQDAARIRPTDIEHVAGDSGLAQRMLGWRPSLLWERTLDDILADWRARASA